MDKKSVREDEVRECSRVEWWCAQTKKTHVIFVMDKHLNTTNKSSPSTPTERKESAFQPQAANQSSNKKRKVSEQTGNLSIKRRAESSSTLGRKSSGVHS